MLLALCRALRDEYNIGEFGWMASPDLLHLVANLLDAMLFGSIASIAVALPRPRFDCHPRSYLISLLIPIPYSSRSHLDPSFQALN